MRIAALAAACGAAAGAADFKDLLGRGPGDANAIVVVDIERIVKSVSRLARSGPCGWPTRTPTAR